uniref:Retrovirus-related Pol polyprotein from transposon opus n=1 Tax=Hirondellea gigas TaxID=1518452 RepID=A0A6A7G5Q4_9CRUS
MASSVRAPKQWCLSRVETVTSFENWRQNIQYVLSLYSKFSPFLVDDFKWEKKTKRDPTRGLEYDPSSVPEVRHYTAQQKVATLELMLGQVANYCPVISRNTIVRNSTSIDQIWQCIRLHYGFQSTGAHFVGLADMKLEVGELTEDL